MKRAYYFEDQHPPDPQLDSTRGLLILDLEIRRSDCWATVERHELAVREDNAAAIPYPALVGLTLPVVLAPQPPAKSAGLHRVASK